MLNKVEGDDDETILSNSKRSLGQLKTKNSSVPTKRTRSESKFNQVNKYKSQEHNLTQESSIGVQPRRVLQSAEASVLQSAQNRVGQTEELRR